ncbi:hypothetical protein [Glycomyces sp. MUSA5-2]|uniref:hypothetical protein n=1 Tax=Glycomyces sp. MUSA5-2 TaxID=2053002 RepID=UPI003009B180
MISDPEHEDRQLRKALNMIGEEAGLDASLSRARRRRWKPSGSMIAAAVLSAAVVVFGGFALVEAISGEDEPDQEEAGQALSRAESIACSTFIGEVEVTDVRTADVQDRIILVVTVLDPIVPEDASGTMEFDVVNPAVADETPSIEPGERLLIQVYERTDEAPEIYRADEIDTERTRLEDALPDAAETSCPAFWQE